MDALMCRICTYLRILVCIYVGTRACVHVCMYVMCWKCNKYSKGT